MIIMVMMIVTADIYQARHHAKEMYRYYIVTFMILFNGHDLPMLLFSQIQRC